MDEQLWPIYALSGLCCLYTLKGVWDYFWYEGLHRAAHEELPQDVEDWITNITPQDTPFMRSLTKDKK